MVKNKFRYDVKLNDRRTRQLQKGRKQGFPEEKYERGKVHRVKRQSSTNAF